MEFFDPHGRDFFTFRAVSKKVRAAYCDYVNRVISIDKLMKHVGSEKEKQAIQNLNKVADFATNIDMRSKSPKQAAEIYKKPSLIMMDKYLERLAWYIVFMPLNEFSHNLKTLYRSGRNK